MSRMFFDHLIVLNHIDVYIKETVETEEDKEELWRLIDETLHAEIVGYLLSELDAEHHEEFSQLLHAQPHDKSILDYVSKKTGKKVEKEIKKLAKELEKELLERFAK